jgi:hypothetical protein
MLRPYASKPQHLSNRQGKVIQQRLDLLGFGSYREYIRSEQWDEKREDYRDSLLPQTCVVCFDPNVDLHHKTYKRLGNERLTDLVPLCRTHHDELHERGLDLWRGPGVLREEKYGKPHRRTSSMQRAEVSGSLEGQIVTA